MADDAQDITNEWAMHRMLDLQTQISKLEQRVEKLEAEKNTKKKWSLSRALGTE